MSSRAETSSLPNNAAPLLEPSSDDLLDQVDRLLQLAVQGGGKPANPDVQVVSSLVSALSEMREALADRDLRLAQMSERSEALAQAQADAIVHSAEIIDELETTKQHLSDARLAAEKAAQDTQRLADTVFERTNDGVLVFQDHRCIACNDNALQLLERDRDQIIGAWPDAFESATDEHGTSESQTLRDAYSAVTDQQPTSTEVLLEAKATSDFWAEITMSAFNMRDANHVLVVVRDITARKRFETELRRHRDFLDNIINAVPDQLTVKSTDRKIVLANDAFCLAHGVGRDEVLGETAATFLPAEVATHARDIEDQLLATGACKTTEHEFRQPDGTRSVCSVKRSSFENETGDKYIVATSRDITDDRIREDRLRLLASVFNGSSEGVAILSPGGRIREANPAFFAMVSPFDQSPVEKLLTDTLQFEIRDFGNVLAQVSQGAPWSGKARGRHHGQGDRSYWVSLSPSSETDEQSTRIIALVSDITELESTQEKLRRQALYDNLTGLPNRRFFRDHLQRLIAESSSTGDGISICFLDLDDFKHVNDSAGHSTGDCLLQAVARRIQDVVGGEAFVARFGGDEFAVIIAHGHQDPPRLSKTLDKLLGSFREPFRLHSTEAHVGLSIGVTSYPDHAHDADTLMCNADIAMYAAKSAGKNRVRFFAPEMQDDVNLRHEVQTRLRRALSQGEIRIFFQPKICAATGRPTGCEALARWQTQDGKFIPPSDFIPIAEQTGLILPLGEIVFQLAAKQACEWDAAGHLPAIAVNISPLQIRHPRFVQQLKSILEETGASAEWFELEITEHAMMDDVDYAIAVIDELAQLGFRIAVDDFGTGYSSLSYLKHFRIHTLKIDLSFVRDVTHDTQSNAVVRSIVSLGSGLGLAVVAEGVETAEQAAELSNIGCTVLQGYHIAKPMTADQYVQWLQRQTPQGD